MFNGRQIGIDVGLEKFLVDSDGKQEPNPRFFRSSEKAISRLYRRMHKKKLHSKNRDKARVKLGKKHLKVQRQRKSFAIELARGLCKSADLIAYEDLKVSNLARNTKLAKSIYDAGWTEFRNWLEYFGKLYGIVLVAVPPHYTSQDCSNCGTKVKKYLSQRTSVPKNASVS